MNKKVYIQIALRPHFFKGCDFDERLYLVFSRKVFPKTSCLLFNGKFGFYLVYITNEILFNGISYVSMIDVFDSIHLLD